METVVIPEDKCFYIWAPRALVGTELSVRENILVEVSSGIVAGIYSMSPAEVKGFDASRGKLFVLEGDITLLPCLLDAHVHLALLNDNGEEHSCRDGSLTEKQNISTPPELEAFQSYGIGGIRDGGDLRSWNWQVKQVVLNQSKNGRSLSIVSTGQALRRKGHYGSFLGCGYSSLQELDALLDRLLSMGIDQVKAILSGLVSFKNYGKVGSLAMSAEELRRVVSRSREQGVKVMAHANSISAVELALGTGVDSLEHGYFINREQLEVMAARQLAWVPTLIPLATQIRKPLSSQWKQEEIELIDRTCCEHMDKLCPALKYGVPLGIGTDSGASGVNPGDSLLSEMLLYSEAGLTNKQVLQAATATNAKIMGLEKTKGALQVGREPALLAVRGDPLADLNALKEIEYYFHS